MSGTEEMSPPLVRVVRGEPDDTELATLVVALYRIAGPRAEPDRTPVRARDLRRAGGRYVSPLSWRGGQDPPR